MKCAICNGQMKKRQSSSTYDYYACPRCRWYATKSNTNVSAQFVYNDSPTFDAHGKREDNVSAAMESLKHYFSFVGLNELAGKRFLDIGCPEGVWVEAAMLLGMDAHGIEIDEPKYQRNIARGLSMHRYDENIGSFDFVLNRHVIEHIENPVEFVIMLLSYVGENGDLYIETPNNDSVLSRKKGWDITEDRYVRGLYPPSHISGLTPKAAKELDKYLRQNKEGYVQNIYTYTTSEQLNYDKLNLKKRFWCKSGLSSNLIIHIKKNHV